MAGAVMETAGPYCVFAEGYIVRNKDWLGCILL